VFGASPLIVFTVNGWESAVRVVLEVFVVGTLCFVGQSIN